MQDAFDGIHQVFGLQISKLLLLCAKFDIEQVVIQLGNNGLQRYAAFHACWTDHRCNDVARIDKAGSTGSRDCSLFKEARRMTCCWDLFYALAKNAPALNDVGDLCLVKRHFNSARPDIIRSCVNVVEVRVHSILSAIDRLLTLLFEFAFMSL